MRVNSRSSIAGECITNRRGCQSKATRTSRTSALFQDILDGCHGRTSARVAAQRGPRRELGSGSVRVLSGWRRAHAGEEVGAGVALHQPIADVGQTLRVGDRRQQLRQAFGGGHSLDHSAARSTNVTLTSSNNSTPLGTSRCTIWFVDALHPSPQLDANYKVRLDYVRVLLMKITSKGQVTIPQRLRLKFGLLPNCEVTFDEADGGVVIRPALSKEQAIAQRLRQARGVAAGRATTAEVMRLTRGDD